MYNVVYEKLRNAMGYKKIYVYVEAKSSPQARGPRIYDFEKGDWFIWMIGRTRRLSPCCAYIRALIYVYIHECTVIFYIEYI